MDISTTKNDSETPGQLKIGSKIISSPILSIILKNQGTPSAKLTGYSILTNSYPTSVDAFSQSLLGVMFFWMIVL